MTRRDRYWCTLLRDDGGSVIDVVIDATDADGRTHSVRLGVDRAAAVSGALRRVLAAAGITGRRWSAPGPIELDHLHGSHAELLVRAVKPLRRPDRLAVVADGVADMGPEEAAYWHAKASRPGGLRALRVLLTEGATR